MASFNAIVTLSLLALLLVSSNAQLTADFYSNSCPLLFSTVQSTLQSAIANDPRNGASIVRLFYLDCFVNDCDASILLDDTLSFTGEKNAASNKNLTRGFDVIDNIKTALENVCPGVVSCADVLAVAAHDSIVALGGPSWAVKLGRRDALTASQATANQSIPAPTSSLDELVSSFARVGLSAQDMVALSGAHTLGQAQCSSFRAHIYSDSDIDATFAQAMRANCPQTAGSGDSNLAPLDLLNTTSFDNGYYKNLVGHKGLLHSDQELFNGGSTDSLVKSYANDQDIFYSDFVSAMIKMGDIKPLMGSDGEIRKNCRVTN